LSQVTMEEHETIIESNILLHTLNTHNISYGSINQMSSRREEDLRELIADGILKARDDPITSIKMTQQDHRYLSLSSSGHLNQNFLTPDSEDPRLSSLYQLNKHLLASVYEYSPGDHLLTIMRPFLNTTEPTSQ
jgi:hypothetical protein